jgi:curved DNA-binding protein
MAAAVGFRDYYETLGVARTASDEEIRSAYRRLAREYHPDVNRDPGAEDRFKEVSEAYEVLRDPEKRERYDRLGPRWKTGEDVAGAGGFGGGRRGRGGGGFGDYEDVRVDFGGGFGGGGFGGAGFSDFFESLFGGRAPGAGGGGGRGGGFDGYSTRGADQEATLDLTLEEAARGGKRRISLDGREYDVEIPAGVRDGQRIRLAGEGEPGPGGGPPGDLYLRVSIRPHPRFRREGNDLHMQLRVAPWEAVLGATVSVQTLTGRARVRVPEGSSCGRRLRLRGQGMPPDGDLYATVSIEVPKQVEGEERELWERLAQTSEFEPRKGRR